jgi:hypothetical protein
MRKLWLLFIALRLCGQTLQLPNEVTATSGSEAVLKLTLSAVHLKLTAMQWDIVIPAEQTTLEVHSVGEAGQSAEKVLQCAGDGRATGKIHTYRCILAGGVKPIPSGDVAELRFKIRRDAGPIKVRIEHAKGVTADLKGTDFAPSEGTIVVR